jgi:hypothetical protein
MFATGSSSVYYWRGLAIIKLIFIQTKSLPSRAVEPVVPASAYRKGQGSPADADAMRTSPSTK